MGTAPYLPLHCDLISMPECWKGVSSPPFPQISFHQLYSKPFILNLNPYGPALSISAYYMGMWLIPKPLTFSDLYCCQDTLYSFPNCSALQKKMSTVGCFCLNHQATGISFIMQTFSYFSSRETSPPCHPFPRRVSVWKTELRSQSRCRRAVCNLQSNEDYVIPAGTEAERKMWA